MNKRIAEEGQPTSSTRKAFRRVPCQPLAVETRGVARRSQTSVAPIPAQKKSRRWGAAELQRATSWETGSTPAPPPGCATLSPCTTSTPKARPIRSAISSAADPATAGPRSDAVARTTDAEAALICCRCSAGQALDLRALAVGLRAN
jgi:hypothetical protein